jgi:hypothetical protein
MKYTRLVVSSALSFVAGGGGVVASSTSSSSRSAFLPRRITTSAFSSKSIKRTQRVLATTTSSKSTTTTAVPTSTWGIQSRSVGFSSTTQLFANNNVIKLNDPHRQSLLDQVDIFIFDCDGVIWRVSTIS